MLPRPIWTALTALVAVQGVVGQTSLANSTNSTNPTAAIIEALPSCAGGCSVNSLTDFENCLCTNVTMQYNLAFCVHMNCHNLTDQAIAVTIEQGLCQGYPQESRQVVAIISSTITIGISLPVLIARLAARWKVGHKLWLDDYMAIGATAVLLGLAGMFIEGASVGFGRHTWNVPVSNSFIIGVLLWVSQILYNVVQCLAKVGILLLYRRIFDAGGAKTKWFRWTVIILIVLTLINGVASSLVMLLQCSPISSIYDKTIPPTKCINVYVFIGATAAIGIIGDFVLIALPIPMLWKLQVSARKKIGIGFMFAVASLGTVASIVRLRFLIGLGSTYDNTFEHVDVITWSLIELLCTVVCGSIPALRPYLKYLIPKFGAITTNKNTPQGNSRPSTYVTKGSRVTSTIYSKSTFTDTKRSSSLAYPMSPVSNATPKYPWEEIPEEPVPMPKRAAVRTKPLHIPINVNANAHAEAARSQSPSRAPSSTSSSSESDLIFQGTTI